MPLEHNANVNRMHRKLGTLPLDYAKVDDIKKANDMGIICGVTTNQPTDGSGPTLSSRPLSASPPAVLRQKPDTRFVTPRQTEREKPQRHAEIAEGDGKFFGTHDDVCFKERR